MKKQWVLGVLCALSIVSCKKDSPDNSNGNSRVTEFQELQVSNSFDWSTTKEVALTLVKVPNATNRPGILTVTDVDGNVLLKQQVRMDENKVLKFTVPSKSAALNVAFGITEKEVALVGNKATFDFLPVLDNSDLD